MRTPEQREVSRKKKAMVGALRGRYERNKCKVPVCNCGKENSQCREIRLQANINNDVICCYDDSDVSVTLLITYLYNVTFL